jgi:hypothetical protein
MKRHFDNAFGTSAAKLLGILLAVAPMNLFGGSFVLAGVDTGAEGQITATPSSATGGSVAFGSCIGNCLVAGTATFGALSVPWSLTSGPFTYNLTSDTLSGTTSSFFATDAVGDKLLGTVTLTSFTQDGSGDAVYSGTDTYTFTLGTGPITTLFENTLTGQGFLLSGGTASVAIDEAACGTLCLTASDPTGSATEIVVTPTSVTAPEPGTIGLLGCGLAALVLVRLRRGPC